MSLSAEAIEKIYERRYAPFRVGATAILGDFDAAHDAVQNGFAKALLRRERCRGSAEAWIWRIVQREALDELRRLRRQPFPEAGVESHLLREEADPALAAAVGSLPPRRRLVVFLRYFADLSYADIAVHVRHERRDGCGDARPGPQGTAGTAQAGGGQRMNRDDHQIDDALRTLAPVLEGDWADVIRRARRFRESASRRRARVVLALAAAAMVLTAGTALAIDREWFGWFSVSPSAEPAPTLPAAASYIQGQTLFLPHRDPQRLAAPLMAPLLGHDGRLAISASDGRILYHSWEDDTPLLFLHDSTTGEGRLLARGAHTAAWDARNRVAYLMGDEPRYRSGHAYLGKVVVGTLDSEPIIWTPTTGPYRVLAWARDQLLLSVSRCLLPECNGQPEPGVYRLASPGSPIALPLASLGALSPDGLLAFGRHDPTPGQDSPSPEVRLVEVATGRVLHTLDLSAAAARSGLRGLIPGSLASAMWRGDQIVAVFSGQDSALVFLSVRGERLAVEQVMRIPSGVLPGAHVTNFGEPSYTSSTNEIVFAAYASTDDDRQIAVVLACDRVRSTCDRGEAREMGEWFAVVTNPSRPTQG